MKIEFLAEGSDDCPLIRLYGFSPAEVGLLIHVCRQLADGRVGAFALHDQPWAEPVGRCQFEWRIATRDLGVERPGDGGPFVLALSAEGWREVEGKLAPFATDSAGFNWLTVEGDVNVLVSQNGQW